MPSKHADVVVIGGGHNGLVAAAYLAKAGKQVLLLERLEYFGGAATSIEAFPGIKARLSRYSYLVSLLPKQVIEDLGLEIELAPRRYSSYTPNPLGQGGLLIDRSDSDRTRQSFESVNSPDFENWNQFYSRTTELAKKLFPSVTSPLKKRSEVIAQLGNLAEFIETPIGKLVENNFESDLVRGVVLTDALIGTFAPNVDDSMQASKCFLYHVIGGETGDWNIPVGGMGAVAASMSNAAERFGAELVSNAEVSSLTEDGKVTSQLNGETHEVQSE